MHFSVMNLSVENTACIDRVAVHEIALVKGLQAKFYL